MLREQLRANGKYKEAWEVVAGGIMAANHGDCHAHQRKATRTFLHTLHQSGEKTVRETATALLEETKAREVLGVFDGIRTLLKHVIADGTTTAIRRVNTGCGTAQPVRTRGPRKIMVARQWHPRRW
jgi:hypothetical protein